MNSSTGVMVRFTCILLCASLAAACDAPVLSEAQFRDRIIQEVRKNDTNFQVSVTGPLSFSFKEGFANLDSGYGEYRQHPEQLEAISDKWIKIVNDLRAPPDASKAKVASIKEALVYVVRNAAYAAQKTPDGKVAPIVSKTVGGDLIAILMVDSPSTLAAVSEGQIQAEGLSLDDAWRKAGENLKKRMGPLGIGDLNGNGPFAMTAQSGLATGLLADPGACESSGMWADGRIVLVLDRDTLISTLPNDPLSVSRFWAFAKPGLAAHQFSSDTPLKCKDGKWVVVEIPR